MNTRIIASMHPTRLLALTVLLVLTWTPARSDAAESTSTNFPGWLTQPLPLQDALNLALQNNRTILKSQRDLEASKGIALQTKAIVIPKLQGTSRYTAADPDSIETFVPNLPRVDQNWEAGIQVVQSLYEGGRMASSWRASKLLQEQAVLQHQTVIANTLLATRVAYYDVLLAGQNILVFESSVNLLSKELDEEKRRYEAGTVPRFNVLRAEVAVANARPPLIRARNDHRIAKNNLANLLGYELPREVWENIPLQLTDKLEIAPFTIQLPDAISLALERRTELGALRAAEKLRQEDITGAKAGRLPSLQAFAGYNWRNTSLTDDLTDAVSGWRAGAQLSWDIFDGQLTKGKILAARAAHEKSLVELDDAGSQIELEVRTAYSVFIGAAEVLESQKKVQEQAEEALRLANSRASAGTGTQLDVLSAETELTQARTTEIQAQYAYAVAVARLERAIGALGSFQLKQN
jgi:outer membrane protein